MRKVIWGVALAMGLTAASAASAATLYNDWNEAACSRSALAGVQFNRVSRIDSVKLWYAWASNQTTASYTMVSNGVTVAQGTLKRGANCFAAGTVSWCDADANVGVIVQPGLMQVRVQGAYICQNAGSRGNGFIKVFGTSL